MISPRKFKELFPLLAVSIIFVVCALMQYDLPGVYMDAVNPEFLAAKGRFSLVNDVWMIPHKPGFAFLGNWHHGFCTLYWGLPIYRFLGTTLFSLRLACTLSGMTTLILVYLVIRKLSDWRFAFFSTLLLACNFIFGFSYRTQQYIVLWGMIPLMGAALCHLYYWDKRKVWLVAISGFLSGLAFYNYFVFIFFLPAFLWPFFKTKFRHIFIWAAGFVTGCLPYVLGYSSYLCTVKPQIPFSWSCLVILFVYALGYLLVYLIQKVKTKKQVTVVMIPVVLMTITASLLLLVLVKDRLLAKPVIAESPSLIMRLFLLKGFVRDVLMGYSVTGSLYNDFLPVSLGFLRNGLWGSVFLLWLISLRRSGTEMFSRVLFLMGLPVSFCVISLLFINRLGSHHFSVLVPLFYLLLGAMLPSVFHFLQNLWSAAAAKTFLYLTLVLFLTGNFLSANYMLKGLNANGGTFYYSEQLNLLAKEALASPDDVYIFPDWGFFMSFKFLTADNVRYFTTFHPEIINAVERKDTSTYLFLWYRDRLTDCQEHLKELGAVASDEKTYYTRNGEEAFYRYTVKKKK